jgi:hypothetical protein
LHLQVIYTPRAQALFSDKFTKTPNLLVIIQVLSLQISAATTRLELPGAAEIQAFSQDRPATKLTLSMSLKILPFYPQPIHRSPLSILLKLLLTYDLLPLTPIQNCLQQLGPIACTAKGFQQQTKFVRTISTTTNIHHTKIQVPGLFPKIRASPKITPSSENLPIYSSIYTTPSSSSRICFLLFNNHP